MMTDKKYQDLVKRLYQAIRGGDQEKARELNKELWDHLSEGVKKRDKKQL